MLESLRSGKNTIKIDYTGNYTKNGSGLMLYHDRTDGNEYIYSHCEPWFANKIFPCFDQPDLKAYFSLKVITKIENVVIANQPLKV